MSWCTVIIAHQKKSGIILRNRVAIITYWILFANSLCDRMSCSYLLQSERAVLYPHSAFCLWACTKTKKSCIVVHECIESTGKLRGFVHERTEGASALKGQQKTRILVHKGAGKRLKIGSLSHAWTSCRRVSNGRLHKDYIPEIVFE